LVVLEEKFNDLFLDLCFLRKDLVNDYGKDYEQMIKKQVKRIENNKKIIKNHQSVNLNKIKWDLSTFSGQKDLINSVFSKLNKCRSILEDSLSKNTEIKKDGNFETFFHSQ